jgi:hypothetical protein
LTLYFSHFYLFYPRFPMCHSSLSLTSSFLLPPFSSTPLHFSHPFSFSFPPSFVSPLSVSLSYVLPFSFFYLTAPPTSPSFFAHDYLSSSCLPVSSLPFSPVILSFFLYPRLNPPLFTLFSLSLIPPSSRTSSPPLSLLFIFSSLSLSYPSTPMYFYPRCPPLLITSNEPTHPFRWDWNLVSSFVTVQSRDQQIMLWNIRRY